MGFYKASDAGTSTRDWISLNFGEVNQGLIAAAAGDRLSEVVEEEWVDLPAPEWCVEPPTDDQESSMGVTLYCEPDASDYAHASECSGELSEGERFDYERDVKAWKAYDREAREEISSRESRDFFPMWSTMWTCEDHPVLRAALHAAGFRVYEITGDLDVDGILFGVDGAGYSFHGAHWIPLRAILAARQCQPESYHKGPALRAHRKHVKAIAALLTAEAAREGDSDHVRAVVSAIGKAAA